MNGPVIIGRISAGESADFNAGNVGVAWKFTALRSLPLAYLFLQTKVANPTETALDLGVYDDDGSGANPVNLLGEAAVLGGFKGAEVMAAKLASVVDLVAGTIYWLAFRGQGETYDWRGNSGGAYLEYNITGPLANPWNPGVDTPGSFDITIWGEAAPPIPIDFSRFPKSALARAAA